MSLTGRPHKGIAYFPRATRRWAPEGQYALHLATIDSGPFGSRTEDSLDLTTIQVTR